MLAISQRIMHFELRIFVFRQPGGKDSTKLIGLPLSCRHSGIDQKLQWNDSSPATAANPRDNASMSLSLLAMKVHWVQHPVASVKYRYQRKSRCEWLRLWRRWSPGKAMKDGHCKWPGVPAVPADVSSYNCRLR